MPTFIIVDNPSEWPFKLDGIEIIAAKSYLTNSEYLKVRSAKIFNLCRSYRYQSIGYYVSLLAAARGHRAIPSVSTIQDFKSQAIVRIVSEDFEELIQKSLAPIQSRTFTLSIYFGKNLAKKYDKLSLSLFNQFEAPLLRAHFVHHDKWYLRSIGPIPTDEISEEHRLYIAEFAQDYFMRRATKHQRSTYRYDLAILVNETEEHPPSDSDALKRFMDAAEELELGAEFISKDDYSRLSEFDALFIRETTKVNHHTFRFAQRAQAEGLVVMDDPESILKCSNKVYLAELLNRHQVLTPKTIIVHKKTEISSIAQQIGFPCVLKQPDSSFSQGVKKVSDEDALKRELERLFQKSDLILVQEFLPTGFDWRVGVVDQKALYVCKYYMADSHWQILNWDKKFGESGSFGRAETFSFDDVPKKLISTAVKASNLIGDGLYGVDLKEIDNQFYVIEVNDNPNIDGDVEDLVIKENLYKQIMQVFLDRIVKLKEGKKLKDSHPMKEFKEAKEAKEFKDVKEVKINPPLVASPTKEKKTKKKGKASRE